MRRWVRSGLGVVAGTLLGLVLSEAAFSRRHGGAFPHLNVYVPDQNLGTRLEPGSTTRIRIANNPPTEIHINQAGFRGPAWPKPSQDEVIVVGDSQVFGLGVSEDDALSAQLGRLLGRNVLNLGVPTYGPSEYRAVMEAVGRVRRPRQVVVVMNMANDLFEVRRRNRERHAVWDGWAVRKETAPEKVFEFPGRKWLFQRSHLMFELRRYLAHRDPETKRVANSTLPSEGSFQELAAEATRAVAEHEASSRKTKENEAAFRETRSQLEERLQSADGKTIERLIEMYGDEAYKAGFTIRGPYEDGWVDATTRLKTARANPGDIVGEINYGEASGPYVASARAIRDAARFRASLEDIARRRQGRKGDEKAKSALVAMAETSKVERELDSLLSGPPSRRVAWSPLKSEFEKMKAVTDEWGAELVIVVLPLDVQVSDNEWAKYGGESVPMGSTAVLNEDAIATARALGIKAVSPLAELRAALPSAFLDGDLHLTAKGNRAVAQAIAVGLEAPRALPYPKGGLPEGLKRVPSPTNLGVEAMVKGSSAAHCETFFRDGWFRALCTPSEGRKPLGVLWTSPPGLEAHSFIVNGTLSMLVSIPSGTEALGAILWDKEERPVRLDSNAESAEPQMEIGAPSPRTRPSPSTPSLPTESEACSCARVAYQSRLERLNPSGSERSTALDANPFECASEILTADPDCLEAYRGHCEPLLACLNGDPWYAPPCGPGSANGGALDRCRALCDAVVPCENGALCRPWQGAHLCFPN